MDIAFIIPVYGQAAILSEAVCSVIEQRTSLDYGIVLVDDLCPDPQTVSVSTRLARAMPEQVIYWRSPRNRGLSAMRNEGVRRALELWPDLYSVCFLDGDDRILPRYAERTVSCLRKHASDASRQIGWVYDDWDYFGVSESFRSPEDFQQLYALAGCQHTASAVCRADMFRAGLWFDEALRGGDAEDWEFWIACMKAGWQGTYGGTLGFRYRRRVGGLAFTGAQQADRSQQVIRKRHSELYQPGYVLAREELESPRYLLLRTDDQALVSNRIVSAAAPRSITLDDTLNYLRSAVELATTNAPYFAVLAAPQTLALLQRHALLDWIGWILEAMSDGASPAVVQVTHGTHLRLTTGKISTAKACESVVGIPTRMLADSLNDPTSNGDAWQTPPSAVLLLTLPGEASAGDHAARQDPRETILPRLQAAMPREANLLHLASRQRAWRPFGLERMHVLRGLLDGGPVLPDRNAAGRTLVAVYARDLKAADRRDLARRVIDYARDSDNAPPSLLLVGGERVDAEVLDTDLDSVFLLPRDTHEDAPDTDIAPTALAGLIMCFGRTISVECDAVVPHLNQVRRYGCKAVAVIADKGLSSLSMDLLNCFKVFHFALVENPSQVARLLALGVSRAQLDTSLN